MRKILLSGLCCFLFLTIFCQSDSSNVVLGIAPLSRTQAIDEKYPGLVLGVIAEQASNISGLNYVSRSPQVLQEIAKEKNIQTDKDWLSSENLAEVGKRLGASYLVTGDVVQVSIEKIKIKDVTKFGITVPVYGKLVTIVINLNIVNVSTGTTTTKQISGDSTPVMGSDETIVKNKIKGMGDDFKIFLQNWYNTRKA